MDEYPDELTIDQWIRIIDSLQDFLGKLTIQFLGGEPTISRSFLPLVAHCAERGIGWGVVTNGATLAGTHAAKMVAARPTNIDISIDSHLSAVHDHYRGIRGSLVRLESGLTRLLAERKQAGRSFPIRLKPTVHTGNADHLVDFVKWVGQWPGVLIDFSPVRHLDQHLRDAHYVRSGAPMESLRRQIDELIALRKQGAPIETSDAKLQGMIDHFSGRPVAHGKGKCRVGLRSLAIQPNGIASFCWNFEAGDMKTQSAREIWAGRPREKVAEMVNCELVRGEACATACTSHRSFRQELSRGLRYIGLAE